MGLIEKMFRQVVTFDASAVRALAGRRQTKLEHFRWLAREGTYENPVPATRVSLAYLRRRHRAILDERRRRVGLHDRAGRVSGAADHIRSMEPPLDCVLANGSYGILRSSGWRRASIVFDRHMTMLDVTCESRMTWTKDGQEKFAFINEEQGAKGR